ncbi:MAG: hypothetical protein M1812_006730 [Candelaria pacifica]|nr:MAG: hypothetical protein M1812_006730 [Candelaria pacifica]
MTYRDVSARVKIPHKTIQRFYRRALNQSMELELPMTDERVFKSTRSGPQKKLSEEQEDRICARAIDDQESCMKTALEHIREQELKISESKFKDIMYQRGYGRGSAGWKTYLTDEQKDMRLQFAFKYYRKMDWKNRAISTDEAKIKKGEHYNGKHWMKKGDQLAPNIKKTTEISHNKGLGNISGSIGYNFKSNPIFLWAETEAEKKEAVEELEKENKGQQPLQYLLFAGNLAKRRQDAEDAGRKPPGREPTLEVFERKNKLKRGDRSKNGMDWYRYRLDVMIAELIPQLECLKATGQKPNPIVMEDNAGNHEKNNEFWSRWKYDKFYDWPPNSPDLNPIEKAWHWCRRYLQRRNTVFKNQKEAEAG